MAHTTRKTFPSRAAFFRLTAQPIPDTPKTLVPMGTPRLQIAKIIKRPVIQYCLNQQFIANISLCLFGSVPK